MLFSKLSRTTFVDKNFRQLESLETQLLWLYLVSSPKNTSLPGLMILGFEEMLADLGWEERLGDRARTQLEASLQELQEKEWIVYHRELGMLLAPRLFDLNVPANPSIVVHWKRLLLDMPRNVLIDMWAGMARRKFRDLDRSAAERLGGKAWRLETLEEFLADIDDCYSPPSFLEYDLLTEEDRKHIRVPANPTKARVYPSLSLRRRKAKEAEATVTPVATDVVAIDPALPLTEDVAKDLLEMMGQSETTGQPDPMALFSTAFKRGAEVVTPHREPATTPTGSTTAESQRKPRVKSDIKEWVSRDCCRLVDFFLKRLQHDKPDAKLPTGETLNAWYDDMDRMLRIDKREVNQIGMLIQWVTQDEFEKANVRCPRKLRQRFDQLELKKEAWEAKQDRISNPPPNNGGYRDRREEPAYPPCFGEIPVRKPEELATPEDRKRFAESVDRQRVEREANEQVAAAAMAAQRAAAKAEEDRIIRELHEKAEVRKREERARLQKIWDDAVEEDKANGGQRKLERMRLQKQWDDAVAEGEARKAQQQAHAPNDLSPEQIARRQDTARAITYSRMTNSAQGEAKSVSELVNEANEAEFYPSDKMLAVAGDFLSITDEEEN